jgi:hypothetical protein
MPNTVTQNLASTRPLDAFIIQTFGDKILRLETSAPERSIAQHNSRNYLLS